MKCFYHKSDLDGHCSGALVKRLYPECEMYGVDYEDTIESLEVSFEKIESVFVVDFRFSEEDMNYLNDNTELHWIDHHKTSIDRAHEIKFIASGGQSLVIGKAGCELTWEYLMEEKMPQAVYLLGRYDVWDHQDARVLPFQYGMREYENTLPDSLIWEQILRDEVLVEKIINNGVLLLSYQSGQDAMYAEGMAYSIIFEGQRAIVMNKAYANSKAFDSVYDSDKHDIMILFGIKEGRYKYTLFSDKPEVDVSLIAKRFGGGGHHGAAGFYADECLV